MGNRNRQWEEKKSITNVSELLYVFVYGTLKPGEANFDRYCRGKTIEVRRAYIEGLLYHLPQLGYPGIIPGNSRVHGFLLSFEDRSVLTDLDDLEDYNPHGNPADNAYTRELVTTCTLEDRATILAWAYFMTPDRVRELAGVLIPDGWWSI